MTLKKNTDDFKTFVLDQLEDLPNLQCRAMFGGHALYQATHFFGILHQGRLYFKTDEASRRQYEQKGMAPFRPNPKQTLKSYYEVPVDILEDPEALVAWARSALNASQK